MESVANASPPTLWPTCVFKTSGSHQQSRGQAINRLFLAPEQVAVEQLIAALTSGPGRYDVKAIQDHARALVEHVREREDQGSGVEMLLHQYDLSSQEGVVLMCLAEALIRIPDADTADRLIRDKLARGDWSGHLGESRSLFVNASTWGLMLTGKVVGLDEEVTGNPSGFWARLVQHSGEPIIRQALRQAMRILGRQFVMGRTIKEAVARAAEQSNRVYRYSFDMLGEAALTEEDAARYLDAYRSAIETVGRKGKASGSSVVERHGISVKLSALYPRYEIGRWNDALGALTPRVLSLAKVARDLGVGLSVDAEEVDRLDLSLAIFEAVAREPSLAGYEGFGLVVQAYQKRAPAVVDWVADLGQQIGHPIPVRLVKGAYWDSEIKRAQMDGWEEYPVFTRKVHTDVSYMACAQRMFAHSPWIYPQFATHNAYTIAFIESIAPADAQFEYQRLHGMGESLYQELLKDSPTRRCRVYAPVGAHRDLLPYLVRRLLENGANTSFVHRISDRRVPVEEIIADPLDQARRTEGKRHPRIPLPKDLYGDERRNSLGINRADLAVLDRLSEDLALACSQGPWQGRSMVNGEPSEGEPRLVLDPSDNRRQLGTVFNASATLVGEAVASAAEYQPRWNELPAGERARILNRAADLLESHRAELMALCIREAGKSFVDSIAEIREGVDHVRYNALQAEKQFGSPIELAGPTGESNRLWLEGRGVFACISPWNFPVAIFLAQVTAALAAGNTVVAKPAEQTSLIGYRIVQLLHEAGVPNRALHLLLGDGPTIGQAIVSDPRVCGVAFTGSNQTARAIQQTLAQREGPMATLIAETGGQNAMIVDSSALPEQVVLDVVTSAFLSAGQRCSALRVLCLQEEIASRVLTMLGGYMATLRVGDPGLLETDVGPVIDHDAKRSLEDYSQAVSGYGRPLARVDVPASCRSGSFVAPLAVELDSLEPLDHEVFGPILHIVRFRRRDRELLIKSINEKGFGLTCGIHSRIDTEAMTLAWKIRAGNCYINRNMVGAVVGVQPFGGRGLSGTGPKAGGPHYLSAFATEKVITVNTAAVGGNASLLAMGD